MTYGHNVLETKDHINSSPLTLSRKSAKVAIIRGELVDLTGAHQPAVILNQLLYWTKRVKDFDLLLEEEMLYHPECNVLPRHGWIYKTAQELNEETMLSVDRTTMRRYLSFLAEKGWIDERINPSNKWDKTTQYRVNLRKLNQDLVRIGYTLPEFDFHEEFSSGDFTPSNGQNEPSNGQNTLSNGQQFFLPQKVKENPNVQNPHSKRQIDHSSEHNAPSKEDNALSNVTNCPLYIQRLQTENTNKEKLATRAQSNFFDEENADRSIPTGCDLDASTPDTFVLDERVRDSSLSDEPDLDKSFADSSISNEFVLAGVISDESVSDASIRDELLTDKASPDKPVRDKSLPDKSVPDKSVPDKSVAAEMLELWEQHVVGHLSTEAIETEKSRGLHLTVERQDQLESLFAFHFKNDMRQWEQFCLRVKASAFLMGHGARKWHIRLDWLLRDDNLSKVLSGKYDDVHRQSYQESCEWKIEKVQPIPALNAEKAAILDSIKDHVWKKWCTKLATGTRLNDFKMLHEPLSTLQLQQIANAWFLEVEDDRLIWVASSDQSVLNAIDNLRLKISWVFAKDYPRASTVRTRLASPPQRYTPLSQTQGAHHE